MTRHREQTARTAGTHGQKPSYIVIARFEALPSEVYCVFRTTLRDSHAAAKRKQNALGLKGSITAVVPYEVDSKVAAKVEQSVRTSLPQFQFGKEALVRCSLDAVHRAIETAFSVEPKQVALRFRILEKQITSLEDQVAKLQTENAQLAAERAALSTRLRVVGQKEQGTDEDLRALREELNEAHHKIGELEDEVERLRERNDEDEY